MDHQGDASSGDLRRVFHAEKVLEARGDPGRLPMRVVHSRVPAARQADARWCEFLDLRPRAAGQRGAFLFALTRARARGREMERTTNMADKVDYKSTMNLPQTEFPMRANLATREPEQLAFWERIGIYKRSLDRGSALRIPHDFASSKRRRVPDGVRCTPFFWQAWDCV